MTYENSEVLSMMQEHTNKLYNTIPNDNAEALASKRLMNQKNNVVMNHYKWDEDDNADNLSMFNLSSLIKVMK